MNIPSYKQALQRIKELEAENTKLLNEKASYLHQANPHMSFETPTKIKELRSKLKEALILIRTRNQDQQKDWQEKAVNLAVWCDLQKIINVNERK